MQVLKISILYWEKNHNGYVLHTHRSVVKGPINIQAPEKTATPYGGRLTWIMPGHTRLVVHMKDKNKMRHRKRWSQVIY